MTIQTIIAPKVLKMRKIIGITAHLKIIFILSTSFFTIAYIAALVDYIISNKPALLWGNAISILLILVTYLFFRVKILKLNRALLIHIAIVSINLYYGILHEAFMGENGSILHVVECMCVCMIPAVLAGLTYLRCLPTIIAAVAVVCYVIAGIGMGNPEGMLAHIPAFTIVIVGLGFTFSYLLRLGMAAENENAKVKIEQRNIARMLDLTPKQWELIKQGNMSRKRMEKLLSKMDETAKEKMLYRMKSMVQTEEDIKDVIREKHPNLSIGDMELCALIVRRKSVTEIAKLQGIKTHSVTARRSRLRTKLGLDREKNLNDYLISLARRKM